MRALIRHLRSAWQYATYIPRITETDDWRDVDIQWLRMALREDSGRKFVAILRNHAIQMSCNAVRDPTATQYRNGLSAGMFMLIQDIEKLSAAGAISSESENVREETGLDAFRTQQTV